MEGSTALAQREVGLGQPAYLQYDPAKIALIKSTLMPPEATDGDLYMLLELSARYKLDPFVRQIWAAKMKGAQGEKGGVVILIGRDGILSLAEQNPDYEGFDSGVVHEADDFKVDQSPGKPPEVTHTQGHPKDRGSILGAWCIAYRRGRRPRYFFAPYSEYVPKSEGKLKYSPWGTTPSVMIEKCAISTAHRLQFQITGLYEPDEMAAALAEQGQPSGPVPVDFGDDPTMALYLTQLFAAAEEARPGSFLPARQRAKLAEYSSPEKRERLAAELAEFIEQHGGTVPEKVEVPSEDVELAEEEVEEVQEVPPPDEQSTLA